MSIHVDVSRATYSLCWVPSFLRTTQNPRGNLCVKKQGGEFMNQPATVPLQFSLWSNLGPPSPSLPVSVQEWASELASSARLEPVNSKAQSRRKARRLVGVFAERKPGENIQRVSGGWEKPEETCFCDLVRSNGSRRGPIDHGAQRKKTGRSEPDKISG